MKRLKRDPVRENRIYNEAIVDARPEEQAMSWYYYLEGKITFPFRAKCVAANAVSPLRRGETVEVLRSHRRLALLGRAGLYSLKLNNSLTNEYTEPNMPRRQEG
jgi:hypothetical protein